MIFEIIPANVEKLSDEDLRELVARLCEAEVREKGYSPSTVTWGGNQNAPDGGIDVRVDLPRPIEDSYVLRQNTGFQVKAEYMTAAKIRNEMSPKGKLRESILELLQNGGAYIIASSKSTTSAKHLEDRKLAMRTEVTALGAEKICIDFYDQHRIARWTEQHPAVALWLRRRIGEPLEGWKPFEDWSSYPGDLNEIYQVDDKIRLVDVRRASMGPNTFIDGIQRIRSVLATPGGIIRLVGLSGVGKTRLVQALFDPRVGNNALSKDLAIYTDTSFQSVPTPLALLERLNSRSPHSVLIIDNCELRLHQELTREIHVRALPVGLITVEFDLTDDEPQSTNVFQLESSSAELLESVLQSRYPGLTPLDIHSIAEFSDGNFRIAFLVADSIEHEGSMSDLKDSTVFERLFRQRNSENPSLLETAKACSLVHAFVGGLNGSVDTEIPILASVANQTEHRFYGNIAELERRRIVQSYPTQKALLPHALASRLARSALREFPIAAILKQFQVNAPKRLLKSFSRRLGHLHDSIEARRVVADWVSIEGWLGNVHTLDDYELQVFDNVASVHPQAILAAIARGLAQDQQAFEDPWRRSLVLRLLHSIAYEPELFEEAVESIVKLVEIGSGKHGSDQAWQTFKTLFSALLSGTHASAKQRADYLRRFIQNPEFRRTDLFLAGLESMLQCMHFTYSTSPKFGSRKRNFGLDIRGSSELYHDWYSCAIDLASTAARMPHLREAVRTMVAGKLPHLFRVTRMRDELSNLVDEFVADGGWPLGWNAIRGAQDLLTANGFNQVAEELTDLEIRLRPRTLRERIECFVFSPRHLTYGLAESQATDERRKGRVDRDWVDEQCRGIGQEMADDLNLLAEYQPELLSREASDNRVNVVAIGIGESTKDPVLVWSMIRSEILKGELLDRFYTFPCGFFYGVTNQDRVAAEGILDEVLGDGRLHQYLVKMQATLGMNATGLARLLEAMTLETVPTDAFYELSWGKTCDTLNDEELSDLLMALCVRPEGTRFAVEIFHMRLYAIEHGNASLSDVLTRLGRWLLQHISVENLNHLDWHHILEICSTCLESQRDDDVAQSMCEQILRGIISGDADESECVQVLGALTGRFPMVVLNALIAIGSNDLWYVERALDWSREYQPCIFKDLPLGEAAAWVAGAPDTRTIRIAELILPWSSMADTDGLNRLTWTPLALELLRISPAPEKVLEIYEHKLHPQRWSEPLSGILQSRIPLLDVLMVDPDARVAEWATYMKPKLIQMIESSIESERRDMGDTYPRFED